MGGSTARENEGRDESQNTSRLKSSLLEAAKCLYNSPTLGSSRGTRSLLSTGGSVCDWDGGSWNQLRSGSDGHDGGKGSDDDGSELHFEKENEENVFEKREREREKSVLMERGKEKGDETGVLLYLFQ